MRKRHRRRPRLTYTALAACTMLWLAGCGAEEGREAQRAATPTPTATLPHDPPALAAPGVPDREIVDRFLFRWARSKDTWERNRWLGIPTLQNPLDAWVTQEIITETKPDVIIEAGTALGGSAALWATILEQVNPDGRVITIDIADHVTGAHAVPVVQRRVDFLHGSSTAPEIVADVKRRVGDRRAMVILDSLHTKDHVLAELRAYAPLVPVGGYIVVQDTIFNGHPMPEGWGPGPYEAVEAFLAERGDFVPDRERERLMMTFNPRGFLRRVK